MEQTAVYNTINFNYACRKGGNSSSPAGAINSTTIHIKIVVFNCPSDGNSGVTNLNSYCGSIGTTARMNNFASTGVFTFQNPYSLGDIHDGSVNTVAFSEALVGDTQNATKGKRGNGVGMVGATTTGAVLDTYSALGAINQAITTCNTSWNSGSNIVTDRGLYWANGIEGYTMFNTIVTPNNSMVQWNNCRFDCCATAGNAHLTKASSYHSGGVNTLFCDGSVKFIKDSINQQTWMAIGTRDNGETVSADQF